MKNILRETLMLLPEYLYGKAVVDSEASLINDLLDKVDTIEDTSKIVEYVNLHRGGITQNKVRIETALRRPVLDAFQFIIHKN